MTKKTRSRAEERLTTLVTSESIPFILCTQGAVPENQTDSAARIRASSGGMAEIMTWWLWSLKPKARRRVLRAATIRRHADHIERQGFGVTATEDERRHPWATIAARWSARNIDPIQQMDAERALNFGAGIGLALEMWRSTFPGSQRRAYAKFLMQAPVMSTMPADLHCPIGTIGDFKITRKAGRMIAAAIVTSQMINEDRNIEHPAAPSPDFAGTSGLHECRRLFQDIIQSRVLLDEDQEAEPVPPAIDLPEDLSEI